MTSTGTTTTLTPAETSRLAHAVLDEIEKVVVGRRRSLELVLLGDPRAWSRAARGRTRPRQDDDGALLLRGARACRSAGCSSRPTCCRPTSPASPCTTRAARTFEFRPGPVFTQLLLADEINRTPPKTQAALLEAMAEEQVSSDGETRPLPQPFIVLATDNPIEYEGTYALPEAQLDRFLLRVSTRLPLRWTTSRSCSRAGCGTAGLRPELSRRRRRGDRRSRCASSIELVQVEPSVLRYVVDPGARVARAPAGHRRRQPARRSRAGRDGARPGRAGAAATS